jgi:hypothetical protein
VAEHPPHDDDDAEVLTVSPLVPLLMKPHADISLLTFLLPHDGHAGFSFPNTIVSKLWPHLSQLYS